MILNGPSIRQPNQVGRCLIGGAETRDDLMADPQILVAPAGMFLARDSQSTSSGLPN